MEAENMEYVEEKVMKNIWRYTFVDKNNKGESLVVVLDRLITDMEDKKSLPNLWKKEGYIEEVKPTYWNIETYAEDTENNCFMGYNPQIKAEDKRRVINFEWMLEGTEENRQKILRQIYNLFMAATGKTATEKKKEELMEYIKERHLDVYDRLPEGWKIVEGAVAVPCGLTLIYNGGSIIKKTLKRAVLIDSKYI